MNTMHHSEMKRLQDILFAMDYNHTEQENEAKQEFQSLRDDIKNKVRVFVLKFTLVNENFFFNFTKSNKFS